MFIYLLWQTNWIYTVVFGVGSNEGKQNAKERAGRRWGEKQRKREIESVRGKACTRVRDTAIRERKLEFGDNYIPFADASLPPSNWKIVVCSLCK